MMLIWLNIDLFFSENIFNPKTEHDKYIDVYTRFAFRIYNTSQVPIAIKKIEKYNEENTKLTIISKNSGDSMFENPIIQPGDMRKIGPSAYIFESSALEYNDELYKATVKYISEHESVLENAIKVEANNTVSYYSDELDEYLYKVYGEFMKQKPHEKVVYKIITSKDNEIWIRLMYPDDYYDGNEDIVS